jgi:hypothetical protein
MTPIKLGSGGTDRRTGAGEHDADKFDADPRRTKSIGEQRDGYLAIKRGNGTSVYVCDYCEKVAWATADENEIKLHVKLHRNGMIPNNV